MHTYARLTPGPGFAPLRALLYYSQRLVTLPPARRAVSSLIAAGIRRRHPGDGSPPRDGSRAKALAELDLDGVAMLPPLLSQAQIARMLDYFRGKPVVGPGGVLTPLERLGEGAAMAAYSLATVMDCPGMIELLNSPFILQLAAEYPSCKPTLSSVGVRWSFPRPRVAARSQEFHRDVDDWRFLKLFIYLTDVDRGSGPHTYVRKTHKTTFGLKARAYSQEALERRFGEDAFLTITGPRGATFVADTLGAHRGDTPRERPRLIFQAQYSLLPIFAFNYAPVAQPQRGFDAYSNRLLVQSG